MRDSEQPTVVLISGASSGIGKACAQLLSAQGLTVYGTSRKADYAVEQGVTMVPMDVRDQDSVDRAIDYVCAQAGTIDVLVNNAGYGIGGAIEDTSIDEAKALFDTNFFGVHRVCQAVVPVMRKQGHGHIINIGSIAGIVSVPFQAFYSATKSALASLSDGLSMELKTQGIEVTRIEPGDYKTGFTASRVMVAGHNHDSRYFKACESAVAVMEQDEQNGADVAKLALKLLSIVRMKQPKLVYREGMLLQTSLVKLLPLLPRRWTQKLMMMMYKL